MFCLEPQRFKQCHRQAFIYTIWQGQGQGHPDRNWPIKLNLTDSVCGAYSQRYVCLTSALWRSETLADLESFREITFEFETIFRFFEMKFILLFTLLLSVILNFWFKHLSSLDFNISTYQCCMAQSRKHLIKISFLDLITRRINDNKSLFIRSYAYLLVCGTQVKQSVFWNSPNGIPCKRNRKFLTYHSKFMSCALYMTSTDNF